MWNQLRKVLIHLEVIATAVRNDYFLPKPSLGDLYYPSEHKRVEGIVELTFSLQSTIVVIGSKWETTSGILRTAANIEIGKNVRQGMKLHECMLQLKIFHLISFFWKSDFASGLCCSLFSGHAEGGILTNTSVLQHLFSTSIYIFFCLSEKKFNAFCRS